MHHRERSPDAGVLERALCLVARDPGQSQGEGNICDLDAKRAQEVGLVIRRVPAFYGRLHEVRVDHFSQRAIGQPAPGDAAAGSGKQGGEGASIVPGEIEADVEAARHDPTPKTEAADAAPKNERAIHIQSRGQCRGRAVQRDRDPAFRKMLAKRREQRSRQNDVADPLS